MDMDIGIGIGIDISACSPLAHGDCRRWFTDAVAGLAYLHYQDIVHFGQYI